MTVAHRGVVTLASLSQLGCRDAVSRRDATDVWMCSVPRCAALGGLRFEASGCYRKDGADLLEPLVGAERLGVLAERDICIDLHPHEHAGIEHEGPVLRHDEAERDACQTRGMIALG